MVKKIIVVGGGIIGLSTALNIQTQIPGSEVKVIADKFDSETTSHGSGGIYFPTLSSKGDPLEKRMRKWSRGSWDFYRHLATGPEAGKCGACISNGYILTRREYPDPLFKDYVFNYRKMETAEMEQFGFPAHFKHGYAATTIILDQRKYLKWLMNRISEKGGKFEKRKVLILREFVGESEVVVNCSGLGSRDLVTDEHVYAVRGQVLKVKATWVKNWICNPESDKGFPTFILPGEKFVTLAGTNQVSSCNLEPSAEDTEDVLHRCSELCPSLKSAAIDHVWVGLRPKRDVLRVEAEEMRFDKHTMKVVHNYGHGSDGVALAWGTAMEAAELLKKSLHRTEARL